MNSDNFLLRSSKWILSLPFAALDKLVERVSQGRNEELSRRERDRPKDGRCWFTTKEFRLVEALASVIVPSDDESPGARDAEVTDSLDRLLAGSPWRQHLYAPGLLAFDLLARREQGCAFPGLSSSQQVELLQKLDLVIQDWARDLSVFSRLKRKCAALHMKWNGSLAALELFPRLVQDVHQAFYTSPESWIWLGYDGPPMPLGYPGLLERRPQQIEPVEPVGKAPRVALNQTLRILVCLKLVPDKESRFRLNPAGTWIEENDLVFQASEGDLYALEQALRLKEKLEGEVVVLSVGDRRVHRILKNGLAVGADRAIHLDELVFPWGNVERTAELIAAAVKQDGFNLVFTGVESGDMACAQTGVTIAHLLGWTHATIVTEIDIDASLETGRVKRELENDVSEWVQIQLPAVLTIQSGEYQPRYPTMKGILAAKAKEIRTISAKDLKVKANTQESQSAMLECLGLTQPERRKQTVMIDGSPDEASKALIKRIHDEIPGLFPR